MLSDGVEADEDRHEVVVRLPEHVLEDSPGPADADWHSDWGHPARFERAPLALRVRHCADDEGERLSLPTSGGVTVFGLTAALSSAC